MRKVLDAAAKRLIDLAGFETLRQQIPLDALQGAAVERAAAQALLERLSKEGTLVDIGEHFGHSSFRDASRDAERFQLPEHAPATVPLDLSLRARAGEGGPVIVESPFPAQARNGLVDIVGFELTAFEAEAQLRLGQLTTGKHSQARLVCIGHEINCTGQPRSSRR
jgi:hypothetical protein